MSLFGPFFAGKNIPFQLPKWTRKKKTVKSAAVTKPEKTRKNAPVVSTSTKCKSAARRLGKCRGPKRNESHKKSCKRASKTLRSCKKKKRTILNNIVQAARKLPVPLGK